MIQLKRYEFTCPFCGESRVTFVTAEKFEEIRRRDKLIEEIFNPRFLNATYREIFVSNICSACQVNTFDCNLHGHTYDVSTSDNSNELESCILEMYENARE